MVADLGLSSEALKLIRSNQHDGESMIATCRAIFSGTYEDEVYQSNLFDVFQLVCDESDSFVFDKFGNFNSVGNPLKLVSESQSKDEIIKIYNFYQLRFQESLAEFRAKFGL